MKPSTVESSGSMENMAILSLFYLWQWVFVLTNFLLSLSYSTSNYYTTKVFWRCDVLLPADRVWLWIIADLLQRACIVHCVLCCVCLLHSYFLPSYSFQELLGGRFVIKNIYATMTHGQTCIRQKSYWLTTVHYSTRPKYSFGHSLFLHQTSYSVLPWPIIEIGWRTIQEDTLTTAYYI
jgi:hypothetical protein